MAAIAITIQTTTAQILDPNGRNGWGTVTIRPTQSFTYVSAAVTYTVSNAAVVIGIADGVIATVDGVSATTFTLSPTTSNSNVPTEVYYIVDIDVNGTQQRKYWVLDYTANTSVEWGSVALLPTADSGTDSAANDIINGTTNLPAYLLRSDTVDAATIGTASDGRGYVGRLDSSTGKFPVGMVPVSDVVSQVITNGVTTKAPSEDAVYDALALKQPLDSDLTAIAALSPSNDDILQRKSGAWTNRTLAQLITDTAVGFQPYFVENSIDSGETFKAPTGGSVYTALALKQGAFSYEDVTPIHAGTDWATIDLSGTSNTRRYISAYPVSATAGALTDYSTVMLTGNNGSPTFGPTGLLTYKNNAGAATLTVRLWYTLLN